MKSALLLCLTLLIASFATGRVARATLFIPGILARVPHATFGSLYGGFRLQCHTVQLTRAGGPGDAFHL